MIPTCKFLFLLAILFTIAAPLQSECAEGCPVDQFLKAQMARHHIPGMSVAVLREGKVVLAKGYGLANVEHSVPATADTVYNLASAVKPLTGTLVMILVEEGKIGLDDKIGKYLPDRPAAWSEITVRHLLSHMAGLSDEIENGSPAPTSQRQIPDAMTAADFRKWVLRHRLLCPPGEKCVYIVTDSILLGMIIEKVTGKPYAKLLDERILGPLQMTATRFRHSRSEGAFGSYSADLIPNRAGSYVWQSGALRMSEFSYPEQAWPGGGLYSTVADLAKFDAALSEGKLLHKESLNQMWAPGRLKNGETVSYGLNWLLNFPHVRGHRSAGHVGGTALATYSRFLDDNVTIILLANLDSYDPKVMTGLAKYYLPPPKQVKDSDQNMR